MAHWTILAKGNEGDATGKTLGITLNTNEETWTAGGPHAGLFVDERSGNFKFVGMPENGTQLVSPGNIEMAFFRGLNGASSVGATGTGRTSKGVTVTWKLDSK